MNGHNGFREDELVTRRMKVQGEWQSKTFPVVGGRLRIAHETNPKLTIKTDLVSIQPEFVIARAVVETDKGIFTGTGSASTTRDARLADSLVELAETRAIARSLRWASYGLETGAEEVSHVADQEVPQPPHQASAKPTNGDRATSAQCRALHALTRKARYLPEDLESLLSPLGASSFTDLTRQSASDLITYLKTEVGQ